MTEKRFELKTNFLNGHVNIVDWVESEQKDAICIFNDLGVLPFSSAPSVCNLLNQFNDENEQLKKQLVSINRLIDNKIDEFKNGDYGDLPYNVIHMFLDLKEEIGDDLND